MHLSGYQNANKWVRFKASTIWLVGPGLLTAGWIWGRVTAAAARRGPGLLKTTVAGEGRALAGGGVEAGGRGA